MPTDFLGRELDDDGDKPQTVTDFARQEGNLTDEDDTGQPEEGKPPTETGRTAQTGKHEERTDQ